MHTLNGITPFPLCLRCFGLDLLVWEHFICVKLISWICLLLLIVIDGIIEHRIRCVMFRYPVLGTKAEDYRVIFYILRTGTCNSLYSDQLQVKCKCRLFDSDQVRRHLG